MASDKITPKEAKRTRQYLTYVMLPENAHRIMGDINKEWAEQNEMCLAKITPANLRRNFVVLEGKK